MHRINQNPGIHRSDRLGSLNLHLLILAVVAVTAPALAPGLSVEALDDPVHHLGVARRVFGAEHLVHRLEADIASLGQDPNGVGDTHEHEGNKEDV